MTALRRLLITGGPDARGIRVVDVETGKVLAGVVKIELLATPEGGALVNVTQACRLEGIDLYGRDAGEPIIDLPDDLPARARELLQELASLAEERRAQPESVEVGQPVVVQRAPAPAADELPLARPITPAVPIEEPDLSPAEKSELAQLLASARPAPSSITPPRGAWPFPSAEERAKRARSR